MNKEEIKVSLIKKFLLALMFAIIFFSTIYSVSALNSTEIDEIRNALINDTKILIDNQTNTLLLQFANVNGTIKNISITQNYSLSQQQTNEIANSLNALINNQVKQICNPYFNNDSTIADPLQKALSGAISNSMDTKFIDQRQWIEQTYIKKNDEYTQLRDEKTTCLNEKTVLQNSYDTAKITSNVSIQNVLLEKQIETEQKTTWQWISAGLAIIIITLLMRDGFTPWKKTV